MCVTAMNILSIGAENGEDMSESYFKSLRNLFFKRQTPIKS